MPHLSDAATFTISEIPMFVYSYLTRYDNIGFYNTSIFIIKEIGKVDYVSP